MLGPLVGLPLLGVVSLALGLMMPVDMALNLIRYGGYYFILLIVALFAFSLWGVLRLVSRTRWRELRVEWTSPPARWCLGLLVICFTLIRVLETTEFKTVMDEPVLLGTAQSMHLDREVLVPMQMHFVDNVPVIQSGYVDKRPLLFPFLVSLLHDFTGYRVANGFVVNMGVTVALLFGGLLVGRLLAGWWGGAWAMLWITSLPLVIRFANSAGFELMNFTGILWVLLAGALFLHRPRAETLSLFALAAVLLTHIRYESGLYLIAVGAVVLAGYFKAGRVFGSWGLYASPLALIPVLWTFQAFRKYEANWQMADVEGATRPFSLSFVQGNLEPWANYFFSSGPMMPNSAWLSIAGLAALLFWFGWMGKNLRRWSRWTPGEQILALFMIGFLLNVFLQLTYFYAQFDNVIVRRLSLPLHWPLILTLVWIGSFARQTAHRRWITALILAGFFVHTLPKAGPALYSRAYTSGQSINWTAIQAREWVAQGDRKLVIAEFPVGWIIHGVESTSWAAIHQNPRALAYYLAHEGNPPVVAYRHLLYDVSTGTWEDRSRPGKPPWIRTEVIQVHHLTPLIQLRLEAVEEIIGLSPPIRQTYPTEERFRRNWEMMLP